MAARGGAVGPYYNGMIDYARDVLGNLGTEFPEWSGLGYQIVGFAWHQGWNDGGSVGPFADYEANLADLIVDVRSEFGLPNLPISIGNSGFGGFPQTAASRLAIINAQLAVADPVKYPAFEDTVFTAETRSFWREANVSPLDQGYHWNQNGETYWLLGKAMGEGMTSLLTPGKRLENLYSRHSNKPPSFSPIYKLAVDRLHKIPSRISRIIEDSE